MKVGQQIFGFRFREDKKPLLVYVKGIKDRNVEEVCFPDYETADSVSDIKVDWDKMIEKTIHNKFEEFINVIAHRQTTLGEFT